MTQLPQQSKLNKPTKSSPKSSTKQVTSIKKDNQPRIQSDDDDSGAESSSGLFDISQADQMKLIEQTGILSRIPMSKPSQTKRDSQKPLLEFAKHEIPKLTPESDESSTEEEEEESDTLPLWVDRAFDTFLWTIPFCTIFICLDVAIHAQYGQEVSFNTELKRLVNVAPSLIVLIHFTLHSPKHLFTRFTLFGLSAIGGSYMVFVMNKYSYLLVMKQTPALGTLWIYSVVRMDLIDAVISLVIVAGWCWVKKLSLMV
ncbi:uncharacterized protein MELLADRAFT_108727 [Melampsora larici-populina 98AG31]|uniref:DUF7719 domain-containing protein n=1 Tax=Melampsora larici-populina (strain 98AG31 / pathotype 3-4-7) TaxID=747676 RepID=F4RU18_MELLP|nr:uncharacterized protein MELLADRAFT_108727 [Melampsora larici-populina 98AG31]EGG04099.1 hypothetical protein MELLADRAFT_108727 [Melampsora larici-populina 98AG31]